MASIDQLKQTIDLHDLAKKLNLVRPGGRGNYRSPHHDDANPSLSIRLKDGKWSWKDFSSDDGGSCIDLIMYVEQLADPTEAMKRLHELYQIPLEPQHNHAARQKTAIENWADEYLAQAEQARAYLVEERKISKEVFDLMIKRRTVGFSTYTNPQIPAGERMHGGPAVAFIVRSLADNWVRGIEYRYVDATLNGGLKTKSQGEKDGYPWIPDPAALESARVVYIVESPINALSVMTCGMKRTAVIATRGASNVDMDWRFLRGKMVFVCFDNDDPIEDGPKAGQRPGPQGAWRLHEALTALEIPCQFVNQWSEDWMEINDVNDYLKKYGIKNTKLALQRIEDFLIPGLPCGDEEGQILRGKPRVYLPPHDLQKYFLYRVKRDHSNYIKLGHADGEKQVTVHDLCGFRIAALSRVRIASATAAMSGDKDLAPRTVFCASVQVPRHGDTLRRKVLSDDKLYNPDQWREFGPVYSATHFARMVNLLERATDIGSRDAVNFVGLAWKDGRLVVNEGCDTFFSDPDQQCPYAYLSFPSGPQHTAAPVLKAYQSTFGDNAALQALVWALGAHLKAFLGFWPHMNMQASKGSGKSTLINRMERTIGFTMFSAQSMQTDFRLLTSISHTSHPVGWEEISTRSAQIIEKAVAMLQEAYQFSTTKRGSTMTEFLLSAPVLLAGEDVPVDGLTGKLVRVQLAIKGTLLPESLPVFPVRQWLEYLTGMSKAVVIERYGNAIAYLQERCSADLTADAGAPRMVGNYAAIALAWSLLADFANIPATTGDFMKDLVAQMNSHITETKAIREPWVWILEIILAEIDAGRYPYEYKFEEDLATGAQFLLIHCSKMMQHLSSSMHLRDKFNAFTVKSAGTLRRDLERAGVLVGRGVERSVNKRRAQHLEVFSLAELRQYGLGVSLPEEIETTFAPAEWTRGAA